jgi:hypothetical protein
METVGGAIAVILMVVMGIVGPLWLGGHVRRAREEAGARQVAVTDAINREIGAAVSPVVAPRMWGPWTLEIAVGREQERFLGRVLPIAARTMTRFEEARPRHRRGFQIVVVPR